MRFILSSICQARYLRELNRTIAKNCINYFVFPYQRHRTHAVCERNVELDDDGTWMGFNKNVTIHEKLPVEL